MGATKIDRAWKLGGGWCGSKLTCIAARWQRHEVLGCCYAESQLCTFQIEPCSDIWNLQDKSTEMQSVKTWSNIHRNKMQQKCVHVNGIRPYHHQYYQCPSHNIRVSMASTVLTKFIDTGMKVRPQWAITSFSIGLTRNQSPPLWISHVRTGMWSPCPRIVVATSFGPGHSIRTSFGISWSLLNLAKAAS